MEAMGSAFEAVFAGRECVDGVQTATPRGIGYGKNVP